MEPFGTIYANRPVMYCLQCGPAVNVNITIWSSDIEYNPDWFVVDKGFAGRQLDFLMARPIQEIFGNIILVVVWCRQEIQSLLTQMASGTLPIILDITGYSLMYVADMSGTWVRYTVDSSATWTTHINCHRLK